MLERVKELDLEGKPYERKWEGKKELGWQLVYNDMHLMAFEGGYLYCQYAGEDGMLEILLEEPKLCDYIRIMLQEELEYCAFDPAEIEDIVSAKLDVNSYATNYETYSQTITDKGTLQMFEGWFGNADYIFGGADCGNESACLELTLANGEVVELYVATDSCSNFGTDGVYYDYRPASDWDNSEFFKCFFEIPYNEDGS